MPDYDKILSRLEKLQEFNLKMLKKWFSIFKKMAINTVFYFFLIYVFLQIYNNFGFEITLIVLLIGIFFINWQKGFL